MAIIKDGEVLRNLTEQVGFLTDIYNTNKVLASWGIKVVGRVDNDSQLPPAATYDGEYGDAYAVGQVPPYSFWIWTRPAIAGGLAYWFNYGPISIVGPQGPVGPQGKQGPQGASTKWYIAPAQVGADLNVGDLLLDPKSGDVLIYTEAGNWALRGNIRGAQGLQGIQGPQGLRGEQGPQGPQGQRGDVGGFISIRGKISNADQLPTPASLDNLTIAYLVGASEPYDLYIQIGETSDVATWNNVGPLNVATLVTVGGEYQNIWDANTKLDKNTSVTQYNQLYAKAANGDEGYINVTKSLVGDAVPQRESDGSIIVPITPTSDGDATSKKYVDEGLNTKLNRFIPTGTDVVPAMYGYDSSGNYKTYSVAQWDVYASPNYIPMYYRPEASATFSRVTGHLLTATPVKDAHAANKKYVDDMSGSIWNFTFLEEGNRWALPDISYTEYKQIELSCPRGRFDLVYTGEDGEEQTFIENLTYLKAVYGSQDEYSQWHFLAPYNGPITFVSGTANSGWEETLFCSSLSTDIGPWYIKFVTDTEGNGEESIRYNIRPFIEEYAE